MCILGAKLKKIILCISLVIIFSIQTIAIAYGCKDLIYPSNLTAEFIEKFQNIAVLKVKNISQEKGHFQNKIGVQILKNIKGLAPLKKPITVTLDNSAAEKAICPLVFETDTNYLLFFNNKDGKYVAENNLNPYRKLGNSVDHSYIADIKKYLEANQKPENEKQKMGYSQCDFSNPSWLYKKINSKTPPIVVEKYLYKSKTVYLFMNTCCDRGQRELYDENGELICKLKESFGGLNDSECPGFNKEGKWVSKIYEEKK